MARPLTEFSFAAFARAQREAARQVLAGHLARNLPGLCGCGRVLPCEVAAAWARHEAHYQARITCAHNAAGATPLATKPTGSMDSLDFLSVSVGW